MRVPIAAILAATAGLTGASMLASASGEAPSTATPPRLVSVEGVASEPISQQASTATADAVYHQGLSDAVADGLAKAQLLAGKAGATVGVVQSIAEGSGYIRCESSRSEGVEYEGGEPDFGSGGLAYPVAAGVAAPSVSVAPGAPSVGPKKPVAKKRKAKPRPARTASAGTCTLYTQVALSYQLG
jgi:hypothetical protein